LADVLRHAGGSVVVADEHDQVGKLLSIRHELPDVALIVSCASGAEGSPFLRSFDAMADAGENSAVDVAVEIARGQPADPAMLCYLTGPAGRPRGVLLSHANLIGAAEALRAAEDFRQSDNCLSFLPMAWTGDRRIVMDGPAGELRRNPEIKEFYLGLNEAGMRRSYREVAKARRRRRWVA
jgi:long-chain acyl-CoA synthetase